MKTKSMLNRMALLFLMLISSSFINAQTAIELPFYEDWSSGGFETNNWQADANWSIEETIGNQAPSPVFITFSGHPHN